MTTPGHERIRVLITVKTYPNPSQRYEETVCTAGVTSDGKWVRLYPITFRRLEKHLQFKKYQWVELDVAPIGADGDKRPESRRPDIESMLMGETIPPRDDWKERRRIIDQLPHRTLKECQAAYEKDRTSLSVVVPSEIIDLEVEQNKDAWSKEFTADFEQLDLFGLKPLKLEKLPYKFQYVFRCKDDDRPHRIMIEDWELGELFLKMRREHESDEIAIRKVREKFLDQMCSPKRDTRFFMGTHSRFPNTWLVIGVFWPPRINAEQLEFL